MPKPRALLPDSEEPKEPRAAGPRGRSPPEHEASELLTPPWGN